jgi:hypothetical protein
MLQKNPVHQVCSANFLKFGVHLTEIFPPFPWIELVHSVDLTDLYTIPLPSMLVSLSIQWTSYRDVGVMPDLIAAKDNILPRIPYLRQLWLYDFSKEGTPVESARFTK